MVIGLAVPGGFLAFSASMFHSRLGKSQTTFPSQDEYALTAVNIVAIIALRLRGAP